MNLSGAEEITSCRLILRPDEKCSGLETFIWTILLKEGRKIIGHFKAQYEPEINKITLQFALDEVWQNKKYMQEALKTLTDYLFEKTDINRVEAHCNGKNKKAVAVMLKCGYQLEGQLRQAQSFGNDGEKTDIIWFALLKTDYLCKKAMADLTVDGLVITNYRESGGLPLRNIMRLPEKEAFLLAERLSTATTSRNDRYGDYFERYYQKRAATEKWLYNRFLEGGGKPKTMHPIYFVLGEHSGFQSFFGNQDKISIPLSHIDDMEVSFTPRDSMHLRSMGMTEGTVWNKKQFFRMINDSEKSVGEFIFDLPGLFHNPGSYIEVQLWNDAYLADYL